MLETFEEAGRVATDAFVGEVCAEAQTPQAVERTVVIDAPASRIVEFARANGFVHVVMGARGHGSLGERLLGSKAERVCQLSEVPVTIVKA